MKDTNQKKKWHHNQSGILAAVASALLFGISPAIAKMAYSGGSNGMTMTFLRAFFGLPVLIFLARRAKIDMRLQKRELPAVILVSLFGAFATTVLFYSSYSYISVGMATVLLYIFPFWVMMISVLFFKEKLTWWKLLSLVLGFLGVLTFVGKSGKQDLLGILLAIGASFAYAGLMIGIERTSIHRMPALKMSIYSHLTTLVAALILGLATKQLNFKLTAPAWFSSLVVALIVAVGAFTLLNYAVLKCGASTTSIIAMLEPLTSVFFGWLLLKEKLTSTHLLGFLLIMLGVILVSSMSAKKVSDTEHSNHSVPPKPDQTPE